jgi:RNA polymerase sigma-70 factor (ECF subfamily)
MPGAVLNRRSPRLLSLVSGRKFSDRDVALALVAGESWATAETWHRFAPMVLAMAERCLGSKAEAEYLTQEVFYRVFRKAATLRDPDSLRSFVYSFAIRSLKNELRRRKVRAWLSFDRPETIADGRSQPPNVESRDLLRKFHSLLDRLSPRDRIVFTLRRMERMTVEEIASHLDISESTVKRSMAHATSRLSRWIEAEPGLVDLLDPERW